MKKYYDILECNYTISMSELKTQYKSMAKKYHPDINMDINAADKFKELNEAYTKLVDHITHHHHFKSTTSNNDIFTNGGFQRTQKKPKKTFIKDNYIVLDLSLIDSINGLQYNYQNSYKCECNKCNTYGGTVKYCSFCNGIGYNVSSNGFITQKDNCKHCNAKGYTIESVCLKCDGLGYQLQTEKIKIKIPPMIDTKSKLISRLNGNSINNIRGDLYITLNVLNDSKYHIDKNNLILLCDVSVFDILFNNIINIQNHHQQFDIKLDKKIQIIKFKDHGIIPFNTNKRGDFIVKINPIVPDLPTTKILEIKKILS